MLALERGRREREERVDLKIMQKTEPDAV